MPTQCPPYTPCLCRVGDLPIEECKFLALVHAPPGIGVLASGGTLVDLAAARLGPGLGFERKTIQDPLDFDPVVLEAVTVEVGRQVDFGSDHGAGARKGTRNGKLVPAADPPGPIVAQP